MESSPEFRIDLVVSDSGQHEDAVFEAALALPADQRAAYLDQACSGKPARRRSLSQD